MSRNSLLRRSAAAAATAAALTMAFQPPALAATVIHHYGDVVTHYEWDPSTTSYRPVKTYRKADARSAAEPPAQTATAPPAQDPPATRTVDTATRIFELTNAERTQRGLEPLRRSDCLTKGAQQWSDRMSREGRIYHSDLGPWMRSCGLNRVGENVARGGRTAERTVQMWMESSGHRENILNPQFTELGIGWDTDGSFATQRFGA